MTETRIDRRFSAVAAEAAPALVTFLTAGDPDLRHLAEAPRGLAGGRRRRHRARHAVHRSDGRRPGDPGGRPPRPQGRADARQDARTRPPLPRDRPDVTPIVLMGYYNPIYSHGSERFVADAHAVGVDGLIVVDLPPRLRCPHGRSGGGDRPGGRRGRRRLGARSGGRSLARRRGACDAGDGRERRPPRRRPRRGRQAGAGGLRRRGRVAPLRAAARPQLWCHRPGGLGRAGGPAPQPRRPGGRSWWRRVPCVGIPSDGKAGKPAVSLNVGTVNVGTA